MMMRICVLMLVVLSAFVGLGASGCQTESAEPTPADLQEPHLWRCLDKAFEDSLYEGARPGDRIGDALKRKVAREQACIQAYPDAARAASLLP